MHDVEEQPMTLLAHGGAGVVNTWGIAYTFGIIGLFSVSLLYIKGKVTERTAVNAPLRSGRYWLRSAPASLRSAGSAESRSAWASQGSPNRSSITTSRSPKSSPSCAKTIDDPSAIDGALHDDIEHVIDDLDDDPSRTIHQQLHDDPVTGDEALVVDRLIIALTVADGQPATSCEA